MTVPAPNYAHLRRLTDAGGLYEHAEYATPRPGHGYCVDDVARALVVTCRDPDPALADLRDHYLDFLLAAEVGGRVVNRRDTALRWNGEPVLEDCWGRELWGLGAAVAAGHRADEALAAFDRCAAHRSPSSRSMVFAGLGAAAVLEAEPGHAAARSLLSDAATAAGGPGADRHWPWPEPRLRYANAAVPEVLVAAGQALGRPRLVLDGLHLLDWLLAREKRLGHLSLTPVGGSGPDDEGARFDQQPIEAAALADACARAFQVTGDPHWRWGLGLAASWFLADNDVGVALYDTRTGAGYDGLQPAGRNANQGAESTLAALSTLQQARACAAAAVPAALSA